MNLRRWMPLGSLVFVVLTSAGSADSADVIAKAREYLGGDAALSAIHSIHFSGTTVEFDGKADAAPYPIEIVFQKDFQQRIVLTKPTQTEIIALDDYEAWRRLQDTDDPTRGQTLLYLKEKVKQLRATTWENLAFFKGVEQVGGTVVDDGLVDLDGKSAHKLTFVHEPGVVYVRYFDPESGRLLLTETDQGSRIREDGEVMAGNVRFPQRIVISDTESSGTKRTVTINIGKVVINETFPDEFFSVPLVAPK